MSVATKSNLPSLPTYYTHLPPFADWFAQGSPILTYHKLGPRPQRVRLKGLYLSRRLFTQQLRELHAAGYTTGSLDDFPPTAPTRRSIVLTFDDGCENVFRHGLDALAAVGFRAVMFVVAERLGQLNDWDMAVGEQPERLMDVSQIREWFAAGHSIGSHTCTHPALTQVSRAQAQEEICSSKKRLEDLFGRPVRHFCYPYGDYNPSVVDLVAQAGYATACTVRGGLNTAATPPMELLRITTRYRSRSLRTVRQWFTRWISR